MGIEGGIGPNNQIYIEYDDLKKGAQELLLTNQLSIKGETSGGKWRFFRLTVAIRIFLLIVLLPAFLFVFPLPFVCIEKIAYAFGCALLGALMYLFFIVLLLLTCLFSIVCFYNGKKKMVLIFDSDKRELINPKYPAVPFPDIELEVVPRSDNSSALTISFKTYPHVDTENCVTRFFKKTKPFDSPKYAIVREHAEVAQIAEDICKFTGIPVKHSDVPTNQTDGEHGESLEQVV